MRDSSNGPRLGIIGLILLALVTLGLSIAAILRSQQLAVTPAPETTSGTTAPVVADPAAEATNEAPPSPEPTTPATEPGPAPSEEANEPPTDLSVVVIGDSYSLGDPDTTWVGAAALELGWTDVTNLSSPGRGYVTDPRSCDFTPCVNFQGSVALIAESAPDVVVTFGGFSDVDADVTEASGEYFSALRAALPDTHLVALTPITTGDVEPVWLVRNAEVVSAAVGAVGGTAVNLGQPGLGDGAQLAPESHAEIARLVVAELQQR